ncbi:MAG: putative Hydrolase, alpha/beta fold family protein [Conexibacter sp.]|nr:putative Hydrolase, alpha/beta fold family protein [Conexibacter sp.]
MGSSVTTVALIHGGQHGGWCWGRVQDALAAGGLSSVAPDLPMEDPAAGAREWARAVVDALPEGGDGTIVVAHSLGGLCVPAVAEMIPVRHLVLVGAVVPQAGQRFIDYLQSADGQGAVTIPITKKSEGEETRGECTWDVARRYFYPDCTEEDARWAWDQLRPRATTVLTESPPSTRWPDVPTTYVIMRDDLCVNPSWSRRVARSLGANVIEMPGGHSPFIHSPEHLADVLVELAESGSVPTG